ncbi:MAG: hypothetical protein K5790_05550 [Nitrosopumilus sp.]|uniref:hypothetical protein n=1 Tax=Nitrosopumilus sp. TaxID=2024843 RepID=UPI00247D3EC2|nr:hypothetical protein [Nitrosopumilus sp.]MCV0392745.1 hypothetical protein [Nitrosopumilus sp.]
MKIILGLVLVIFVTSITPAFAQHHSGSTAPPIDLGGINVAVTSILSPLDFIFEDSKSANLSIRFFNTDTNINIPSVTYRVQIYQEDNLVANEYFFDEDGKLDLEIRPTTGCQDQNLWKCTKYFGEKHAIAGGYYARGDSRPIIQGPVFDKNGEYTIKVSIVGATNPKTMTTSDLLFETFLSIPLKETFVVKTANAQEYPIVIKSYDSQISNFSFDENSSKLSYEMSYELESEQDHSSKNTNIIYLQKNFPVFKQGYDIGVYVEGIKLPDNAIVYDISSTDENILRISIPHEEMMQIETKLNSKNSNNMNIEIISGQKTELHHLDFTFENGYTANVTWDSKLTSGKEIPFTISFFDNSKNLAKNTLFAYSISDSSGKDIWSNIGSHDQHLGLLAQNGVIQESILIPKDGKYQFKLILTGQNSKNFDSFFTSKSDFSFSSNNLLSEQQTTVIPSWIKNSAGWWADGIVADSEFIQSIQFLIKEKLLIVNTNQVNTNNSEEIPLWIKNNAGWWAQGLISERDFVKGIEFLISQGIIKVS